MQTGAQRYRIEKAALSRGVLFQVRLSGFAEVGGDTGATAGPQCTCRAVPSRNKSVGQAVHLAVTNRSNGAVGYNQAGAIFAEGADASRDAGVACGTGGVGTQVVVEAVLNRQLQCA